MISDLSKVNNNWIYQSNKLIEASHSFSLLEQKLIRILASMIKKDDVDFKEYQFKAIDLSKILCIQQKNIYREIDKVTDKLMARVIKRKNDTDEKFQKYHLIKKVEFENGTLTMKIDEEVREFYLELKQYTKYQLKNILKFNNSYSFRVYELLKQYEIIGSRLITIDDLKSILDIDKNQYQKYANLKQKVINVTVNEININTDLHIEFEELKYRRKVTSIKFHITSKVKARAKDEIAATITERSFNGLIKQVQAICNKHKITEHEASCILSDANNNIGLIKERYNYLLTQKKVDNVVGYMRSIIVTYDKAQKNIKIDNFNNYEQREYDFEKLEKNLTAWE